MPVLSPSAILQPRNPPALQSSLVSISHFEPSLARPYLLPLFPSRVRLALPIPCEYALPSVSLYFRNTPLIFPVYCRFALIFVIQTLKMHLFLKIFREKFGGFRKMQYFCTRFRENGTKHRLKESEKKEFFDKIYINRKQQYKKQVRDHLGNKRTDQFGFRKEARREKTS